MSRCHVKACTMSDSISTGFTLNSDESGFNTRCNDVFASLATLEKKHDALTTVQSRKRSSDERHCLQKPEPCEDPVQPQQSGSSFRNPSGRARRSRYKPGFRKDPEKWTSYDLSNVSRDQLSDRGNTAAALSFLQERRMAREGGDETPADLAQKVEFSCHRTSKDSKPGTDVSTETKFRGGKIVMPEYDMGQRNTKPKQKCRKLEKSASTGSSAVNLDYLQEEDEEDTADVISTGYSEQNMEEDAGSSDKPTLTSGTKGKADEEINTETDCSKPEGRGSESKSSTDGTETKFKKKSGRKGIRQRQRDEDDD